jgi:ADP-ribose pyrophosphatase YjhB (NUDIX family)
MADECRPVVAVAAIVYDPQGRVLLVERGKPPEVGSWTVPGGRLEANETLAQGAAREVREETGLIVEVGALACVVERMGDDFHFVILDYVARVIGGELAAGDDAKQAKWVDEGELQKLPLSEGLQDVLARARKAHGSWFTR